MFCINMAARIFSLPAFDSVKSRRETDVSVGIESLQPKPENSEPKRSIRSGAF